MGKISIIRQQHQPFAVEVQPADRKHPHGNSSEIILDGRAAAGIVQGEKALGRIEFVEEEAEVGAPETEPGVDAPPPEE